MPAAAKKAVKKARKKAKKKKAAKAAKSKAIAKEVKKISVVPIKQKTAMIVIEGQRGSILCLNRWSEKAYRMMLNKQMGIPVVREKRDPELDYVHSMYYLPKSNGKPYDMSPDSDSEKKDGGIRTLPTQKGVRFGFPVVGVKEAMASAAYRTFGYHKVDIYSALFLQGEPSIPDGVASVECAEIIGTPVRRDDFVRNAGLGRTADLRFRGYFAEWKMVLHIKYNPDKITAEDIANLLMHAGHSVGIGEYRVEKGGEWGRFTVATGASAKKALKAAG